MIKTKRLEIKPYDDRDKDKMIELLTNEEIKKTYMIPDYKSKEQLQNMFEKLKEFSYLEDHYERGVYLNNNLIGFVNDVELKDKRIEIGYVIHPKYHNLGYATETLKAVIDDLFKKGIREVITAAFIGNKASIRVMEKCGMRRIEKSEDITYQGKIHHCIYYLIKN